jgi:rhamnopyranosyl-N-acetylglucosaminyl-diphospho-decaprenol beta-1,3/1,4-galactofuranosyltransferase
MKIVALVITYNRKAMLQRCLERLLAQQLPIAHILVFNNASTDDTKEYLSSITYPTVEVHHEPQNIGGAGGYHEGLKKVMAMEPDWVWCVEDDIMVPRDFLFKAQNDLKEAKANNRGFVYPQLKSVYEPRGIQRPQTNELGPDNQLERAVFAGCLLNGTAIAACGYPIKKYFIYFDDWEYTSRLTRNGFPGVHIPQLHLWHHDPAKPMQQVYINVAYDQLWKSLYGIRNELSFYKTHHPMRYPKLLLKHTLYIPLQILLHRPNHKLSTATRWFAWSLRSVWF